MISESYTKSTFWLVIFGIAWPGVTIVGLIYSLELFPANMQKLYMYKFLILQGVSICTITIIYSFPSRDWFPIFTAALIAALVSFVYCILLIPESLLTYYNE